MRKWKRPHVTNVAGWTMTKTSKHVVILDSELIRAIPCCTIGKKLDIQTIHSPHNRCSCQLWWAGVMSKAIEISGEETTRLEHSLRGQKFVFVEVEAHQEMNVNDIKWLCRLCIGWWSQGVELNGSTCSDHGKNPEGVGQNVASHTVIIWLRGEGSQLILNAVSVSEQHLVDVLPGRLVAFNNSYLDLESKELLGFLTRLWAFKISLFHFEEAQFHCEGQKTTSSNDFCRCFKFQRYCDRAMFEMQNFIEFLWISSSGCQVAFGPTTCSLPETHSRGSFHHAVRGPPHGVRAMVGPMAFDGGAFQPVMAISENEWPKTTCGCLDGIRRYSADFQAKFFFQLNAPERLHYYKVTRPFDYVDPQSKPPSWGWILCVCCLCCCFPCMMALAEASRILFVVPLLVLRLLCGGIRAAVVTPFFAMYLAFAYAGIALQWSPVIFIRACKGLKSPWCCTCFATLLLLPLRVPLVLVLALAFFVSWRWP